MFHLRHSEHRDSFFEYAIHRSVARAIPNADHHAAQQLGRTPTCNFPLADWNAHYLLLYTSGVTLPYSRTAFIVVAIDLTKGALAHR